MPAKTDITKLPKYGRLTIVGEGTRIKYSCGVKLRYVKVICDCGNKKEIILNSIVRGQTKSCGCLHPEKVTTHGLSKNSLHIRWKGMLKRCYDKKHVGYKRYGGRGISVCNEWKNDQKKFIEWALTNGYKKELQLDRINNDGNYEPNNCRWATAKVNGNNKSKEKCITYKGETKTATQWSEIVKVKRTTILERIKSGWSIEKSLETPTRFMAPYLRKKHQK
jgi:hypothetical protein